MGTDELERVDDPGAEVPGADEADIEHGDEPEDEPGEEDEPASPPATVEGGPARVAPSSGEEVNRLAPSTSILVTLRRDFPVRQGERLGEWRWSSADGNTNQAPQRWQLAGGDDATPLPDQELEADDDRPMIGWSIGRPSLGSPGDQGGQRTTDRHEVIAGELRLRDDRDVLVSSGTCAGRDGECRLTTHGLTGTFTIEFSPERLASGPAGPAISSSHEFLYRGFQLTVRLRAGLIVDVVDPYDPPNAQTVVRVGNRKAWTPKTSLLPLSIKPEWWRHPHSLARPGGSSVSLLVLHCTGGYRMGNGLNRFLASATGVGAHYLLDVDGHAVKLANEDRGMVHAQVGRWGPIHNITANSVGIEIINPNTGDPNAYMARAKTDYTEEQYATVERLVRELTAAHPGIEHRVVGHSDVATGNARGQTGIAPNTYGNKRSWDPGAHFEWERLEVVGLGMVPGNHFDATTSYAGVFSTLAGLTFVEGDRDPHGRHPARYGGEPRPDLPADINVIEQIQTDVRTVGYSLFINGRFDHRTFAAVDRFRRHFFTRTMTGAMNGRVDQAVAQKLFDVAQSLRSPAPTPPIPA